MSNWDPKEEWKIFRLETEAIYLYEQTAKGNFLFLEGAEADSTEDGTEAEIESAEKCTTWEHLRAVVALMAHGEEVKKLKNAGGKVGSAAATILGLIPGTAAFVNWAQLPSKVMKKPRDLSTAIGNIVSTVRDTPDAKLKKPAGGILDAFVIDDGYQKIVDKEVEAKFLEDFEAYVSDPKKTGPLPDKDINEWFEQWLSKNHGSGDETVTGAESKTKFTDIPRVEDHSKLEKSIEKIGGTIGSTLKGFIGF